MLGSVSDNGKEDESDELLVDIVVFNKPIDRTDLLKGYSSAWIHRSKYLKLTRNSAVIPVMTMTPVSRRNAPQVLS